MSTSCEEELAENAPPGGGDVAAKLEASEVDLEGIEDDDKFLKDLRRVP